jgi:twinkle protein
MWAIGTEKLTDLFGWAQARKSGARRLIITEGEYDAVALHRIFEMYTDEKYKDTIPAIVSICNGASGAVKDIGRNIVEIRKYFKEVAICFDDDDAGRQAVADVHKAFPEFQVINLPGKDANDCLMNGSGKAARNACVFKAETPKNSRLINAKDLFAVAKVPAKMGFSWPWDHITKATKGIRLGETIYIGAGQKQGKSEIVNTLAAHFIKTYGWKVLLAKPEEANNKTVKLVAGKVVGKRFHDPDVQFDEEAYDSACDKIGDKLILINLYQHLGYETLRDDIRASAAEGVKAVFIDPITNLVNGLSSAEQNVKLQEIAQDLSALALDLNIVIFIFCHLRNPDSGEPHERGGKVESHQFSGSRAMARSCNLMLGLEGNRDPDLDEDERNMKTLVLLEDREFGNVGRFKLFWDKETTLFNEVN